MVNIIKNAIDHGYRHIDTASLHKNEKQIGEAIKKKINEHSVKRFQNIYINISLSTT